MRREAGRCGAERGADYAPVPLVSGPGAMRKVLIVDLQRWVSGAPRCVTSRCEAVRRVAMRGFALFAPASPRRAAGGDGQFSIVELASDG